MERKNEGKRVMPERIDAPPEQIAKALFKLPKKKDGTNGTTARESFYHRL